MKDRQATLAVKKMEQEIEELKARQAELLAFQKRLQTEEGIEYELRKKFGVARPGESVAIIVEENSTSTTTTTDSDPWQKIKNFFTSLFE